MRASIGWHDRAREPAVVSVVVAVLAFLALPWIGGWSIVLWGYGAWMGFRARRLAHPGLRSTTTRVLAIIGAVLNSSLLVIAMGLLVANLAGVYP